MKTPSRISFALVAALETAGWLFAPDIASDFTWMGLIVTTLFAWSVAEALRLSAFTMWLALLGLVLDGLSALYQLYSRIEPWDLWVHAWGGLIIAIASLELLRRGLEKEYVAARRRWPFLVGGAYLFTIGVGFLYEFWEYLVDRVQYGAPKSLVSAYDSIEDQLFNLLGATIALGACFLWERQRQNG